MDKNNRINELKRKARRNALIDELKMICDVNKSSFLSPNENDEFCKSVFEYLRNLKEKYQFGNENFSENVELSRNYLDGIIANKINMADIWYLFFFRKLEIEALPVCLSDIQTYLVNFFEITKFKSGRADFILITKELSHGIVIERGEYFYELYEW